MKPIVIRLGIKHGLSLAGALAALAACSPSGLTPKDACPTLARAVGGTNCHSEEPGGVSAGASSVWAFDLASPAGKSCQVLGFASTKDLESTEKLFDAMAALTGPYRYANRHRLIYVQCSSDMSAVDGAKVEKVVEGL